MSKEIKKHAKAIFSKHPKVKTLYVNPKGEFFTRPDLAKNSLGIDEEYKELHRAAVEDEPQDPITELSIKDLSTHLEGVKEVAVAEQMLLKEQEAQNRKGAIAVIETKIEELKGVGDES